MAEQKQMLTLSELSSRGLDAGIKQVEAAGSPLHPFLIDESGKLYFLFNEKGADPMALACAAIKKSLPNIQRCALVLDSRLTFTEGRKWDAIVVMTCERGQQAGEVWAQRYVPKSLLRTFRTEGESEMIARSGDFISAALGGAPNGQP